MASEARVSPRTHKATTHHIRTPDQRLRVFVSSTLEELAPERAAVQSAIGALKLIPVMFELGARPHPPRALYRSYLDQSHIFVAVYWKSYGWVAPDMKVSGIEDEYRLSRAKPKLIYIKEHSAERDPRLQELIRGIQQDDSVAYKYFDTAEELRELIADDLALLLTERFERSWDEDGEGAPGVAGPVQADDPYSNLPAMVNLFVGRDREMAALHSLVETGEARLITLTGPGGIGKSRLALEFANATRQRFSDGASLVLLQSVRDPALVGSAIAQTLHIPEIVGRPMAEVIAHELGNKKLLLLLDNFEHLLPAADLVGELVTACPNLVMLVTSRSPLNLRGEHEVTIPPLGVPSTAGAAELDLLTHYAAVRLFIDRALSSKPDFEVTEREAPAIAAICHRLDGIPLAIELAAARIRMLTPEAMLDRLTDRFGLLKGGWRDLPERHKTLRSTIDWSFDLLDEDEKTLFRRAGVFNGGWTLDAIEEVCAPDGELDTLELMASLVDKSLVYPVPGEEPRFSMLETIREYATDRLREAGEHGSVKERHANLFMEMALAARPLMRSPEQERALNQLDDEAGNLAAALRWMLENDRHGDAAECAWSLWLFWWLRDRFEEGMTLTEEILATSDLTDHERSIALASAGCIAFWRGDYGNCMGWLTEALELFRASGDDEGIALCQLPLGIVGSILIGPDDSFPRFEESRGLFTKMDDLWGSVLARNAEAWLNLGLGTPMPDGLLEETIDMATELGTEIEIGMANGNMGGYAASQGRLEEARYHLRNALELLSKHRVRNLITYSFDQVAELCLGDGDAYAAARLFGAADALRERIGSPVAPVHQARRDGLLERAVRMIGRSRVDAARSEGGRMAFSDAVREALGRCSAAVPVASSAP